MEPFIGQIIMFAGNFAPRGWAFCEGQLLAISQNTALFSILGTLYGGDGRTTFALPDLRGRVPLHPGNGPGLTPRSLGQRSGTETNTLNTAQIPPHNHSASIPAKEEANAEVPNNNVIAGAGFDGFGATPDSGVTMSPFNTSNTGGGLPVNNMQPFLSVNFIIALTGIYPSRS